MANMLDRIGAQVASNPSAFMPGLVDNHPDNNISHLPTETPPDGTSLGVSALGIRKPNAGYS